MIVAKRKAIIEVWRLHCSDKGSATPPRVGMAPLSGINPALILTVFQPLPHSPSGTTGPMNTWLEWSNRFKRYPPQRWIFRALWRNHHESTCQTGSEHWIRNDDVSTLLRLARSHTADDVDAETAKNAARAILHSHLARRKPGAANRDPSFPCRRCSLSGLCSS